MYHDDHDWPKPRVTRTVLLLAGLLAFAAPAWAHEPPTEGPDAPQQLDPVIVSGERPVAASSFPADYAIVAAGPGGQTGR